MISPHFYTFACASIHCFSFVLWRDSILSSEQWPSLITRAIRICSLLPLIPRNFPNSPVPAWCHAALLRHSMNMFFTNTTPSTVGSLVCSMENSAAPNHTAPPRESFDAFIQTETLDSVGAPSLKTEFEEAIEELKQTPLSPRALSRRLSRRVGRTLSLELLPQDSSEEVLLSPEAKATVPRPTFAAQVRDRLLDFLLITKLAAQLYGYLAGGTMWVLGFWRLVAFALILMPGFLQMIIFYFFSPRMLRSIPYGIQPRNRLDIYVPRRKWLRQGPRPVVIFITGGAWTIGYKAWGSLLGRRLSQRGVLVFSLDYRNFPQGYLPDMLEDVNTGINWVLNNAWIYGGDAASVYIVGQSAGAQLGALAVFAQAQQKVTGVSALGGAPSWDPSHIKGFAGVSGPYNMYALADHLHRRGLYKNILHRLMSVDGRVAMRELSPTYIARKLAPEVVALLPPFSLLHGTADKTVPMEIAVEFVMALKERGVAARLKLYGNKTHTQPLVEDPMRGGRDELMDDILSLVSGKREVHTQFPMMPSLLIDMASWVCPF